MGILLCEHNFRKVWIRNENVRAEIGQILHTDTHPHTDTHTHTHTHTTAISSKDTCAAGGTYNYYIIGKTNHASHVVCVHAWIMQNNNNRIRTKKKK